MFQLGIQRMLGGEGVRGKEGWDLGGGGRKEKVKWHFVVD